MGGFGSGGISSFMILCNKDSFINNEQVSFTGKVDNSRCSQKIRSIELRLIRFIRLNTGNLNVGSTYDTLLTQEIFKTSYDGLPSKFKDRNFSRLFSLNLEEIF